MVEGKYVYYSHSMDVKSVLYMYTIVQCHFYGVS